MTNDDSDWDGGIAAGAVCWVGPIGSLTGWPRDRGPECPQCRRGHLRWYMDTLFCNSCGEEFGDDAELSPDVVTSSVSKRGQKPLKSRTQIFGSRLLRTQLGEA